MVPGGKPGLSGASFLSIRKKRRCQVELPRPMHACRGLRPSILELSRIYRGMAGRGPEERGSEQGCYGNSIGTLGCLGVVRSLLPNPRLQLLHPCSRAAARASSSKACCSKTAPARWPPRAASCLALSAFCRAASADSRSSITSSTLEYIPTTARCLRSVTTGRIRSGGTGGCDIMSVYGDSAIESPGFESGPQTSFNPR